jgi:O-antigen/teichoic acid export membrane protein
VTTVASDSLVSAQAAQQRSRGELILRQALQYFSGSGLAILGSVISYPLLTRLLTQRDYGMMTIISSSIFLAVAFSKMGLQQSVIRFFPQYVSTSDEMAFRSTLFWVPVANSVVLSLLLLGILSAVAVRITDYPLRTILLSAAPIAILETALALMVNFMRAAQQAGRYTIIYTVSRYGQLAACLAVLIFYRRDLVGFYLGWLVWDICLMAYLFYSAIFVEKILTFGPFDRKILRIAAQFGAPLLFMEIGNMILTYGDRYVIASKLGAVETGIYSAAYNFTASMQLLFVTTLSSFIFPWASEIWTKHSREETERFAANVLDYFLLIAIPACLGVCVLRGPIMLVFASAKYAGSSGLLPPLIWAQLSYGVYVILSLGLFLQKRTGTMAWQMIIATAFNIAANLILIPRVGLMGAAWAMVIANSLLILMVLKTALPLLRVNPNWILVAKSAFAAAIMTLFVYYLPFTSNVSKLLLGSSLGVVLYAGLMFGLDADFRRVCRRAVMSQIS